MSLKSTASKTEQLVMTALMTALVLIGTVVIRIPIPMTQGFVHLGDAMIYIGVLLLGRKNGTAAAALGSVMADILSGYAFWAPWTLIIKAAMAYVAGIFIDPIAHSDGNTSGISHLHIDAHPRLIAAVGMSLGGLLMTAGYYVAESVMYGSWPAAALGIPWNIGQFAVGIMIALSISTAVSRIRRHV